MKLLEERIRKDGTIRGTEVLKVDRFLNHQMDIGLINEIASLFIIIKHSPACTRW